MSNRNEKLHEEKARKEPSISERCIQVGDHVELRGGKRRKPKADDKGGGTGWGQQIDTFTNVFRPRCREKTQKEKTREKGTGLKNNRRKNSNRWGSLNHDLREGERRNRTKKRQATPPSRSRKVLFLSWHRNQESKRSQGRQKEFLEGRKKSRDERNSLLARAGKRPCHHPRSKRKRKKGVPLPRGNALKRGKRDTMKKSLAVAVRERRGPGKMTKFREDTEGR